MGARVPAEVDMKPWCLLAVLALSACEEVDPDAVEPDEVELDVDTGEDLELPPPRNSATLSELQDVLFTPTCTGSTCHSSPGAAGLVLEEGLTYRSLVNVPALGQPHVKRVEPGVAVSSYLSMKLEATADIEGLPMPIGLNLDSTMINRVNSWIDAGALDN